MDELAKFAYVNGSAFPKVPQSVFKGMAGLPDLKLDDLFAGMGFNNKDKDTDKYLKKSCPCPDEFEVRLADASNSNPCGTCAVVDTPLRRNRYDLNGNDVGDYTPDKSGLDAPGDFPDNPTSSDVPSARFVSNTVHKQTAPLVPNQMGWSDFLWAWGQFLDHDLDLTPEGAIHADIGVPTGDPTFDPQSTGTQVIPFKRARVSNPGDPEDQQVHPNIITGYIDGSNVYGSSNATTNWIRTFEGGRIKMSPNNLLRYLGDGQTRPPDDSVFSASFDRKAFIAGDERANENPVLASIHTLWAREHNRLADEKTKEGLNDEEAFQCARRLVVAQLQHISYAEFLPRLVGPDYFPMPNFDKPDGQPNANCRAWAADPPDPSIEEPFSGAAFRVGHTLVTPDLLLVDDKGKELKDSPIPLRETFNTEAPELLERYGIEAFLLGLTARRAQTLDVMIADDLRNMLFFGCSMCDTPRGTDLISLNIQRGRDLGIPRFNALREVYGLTPFSSFSEFSEDATVVENLMTAYGPQGLENVDAFTGMLAEVATEDGTAMGSLMRQILKVQFNNLRAGDLFWYECSLTSEELEWVRARRLSDVILDNTDVKKIQDDVFMVVEEKKKAELFEGSGNMGNLEEVLGKFKF